jgi:glycosyltransferase involved in cell wall biosynthesis
LEKIEFIIPCYNNKYQLKNILYSLLNQSNPNWIAHVISDGEWVEYDDFKIDFERENLFEDKIKFSLIEGPNKDWGHTARNYGLEQATQDWIVMTGSDNYYMPDFVNEFLKYTTDNNFIFCNMVHNEAHYKHYQELKAELTVNNIDMGCFATKTKNAQQLRLNKKSYQADWEFVEKYITLFPGGIKHISKILYVHN